MVYQSVVLSDSPSNYWRMGETAGSFADSVGSVPAAIAGSPTQAPTLILRDAGHGSTFDGSTVYGTTAASALFTQPTAFSFEFWMKPTAIRAMSVLMLASTDSNFSTFAWLFHIQASGIPYFEILGASGFQLITSTTTLRAGSVYHVVCTFSSTGNGIIYINGAVDKSVAIAGVGTVTSNNLPLNIGNYFSTPSHLDLFDGVLQEIAYYPRVVSAARVREHYNVGIGTNGTVLG